MPHSPNTSPHDAPNPDEPAPDDLSARLEHLTAIFAEASAAAEEVLAALRAGRRPQDRHLEPLHRTALEFDEVVRAVTALGPADSAPVEDLGGIASALERFTAERAEREALCARFTRTALPGHLEEIVEPVRTAAREGEQTEHLAELAALADALARDRFHPANAELFTRTIASLPEPWHGTAVAIFQGEPVVATPGTPAPPPPAAAPSELDLLDERIARDTAEQEGPVDLAPEATGVDGAEQPSPPDQPLPQEPREQPDGRAEPQAVPRARPEVPEPTGKDRAAAAGAPEPAAEASIAPAGEPERTAPAAHRPPLSPDLVELDRTAVGQGRVALSGWLYAAAGLPEVAEGRFLAALAGEVTMPDGEQSLKFVERASRLIGHLPDARGERILLWAAALRAGLVSPSLDAYHLMERCSLALNGRPALTAVHEAFGDAAQRGVRLNAAESSAHLHDIGVLRRRREAAVARARDDSEHSARRKLNYQSASRVWQRMVSPDGDLRLLIDIPASDDASRVEELHAFDQAIDAAQLIDEIHGRSRKHTRSSRKHIEAKARHSLLRYIGELRGNAHTWIDTVRRLAELELAETDGSWELTGLNRLSSVAEKHLPTALAELEPSEHEAAAPALSAARELLSEVGDLLTGSASPSAAPADGLLLVRDLLRIPECRITSESECSPQPAVDDIRRVLTGGEDWPAAFASRVERGDLVGAALVAKTVRPGDPALADRMDTEIETRTAQERTRLVEDVRSFQRSVSLHRLYGSLSEDEANSLYERAEQTAASFERRDFDVLHDRIAALEEQSAELRKRRVDERRAEVGRLAREHDAVALHEKRLYEYLDHGRITTSDEIIAHLVRGQAIPEENPEPDHFTLFFPRYPQVMESAERNHRLPELHVQLRSLIEKKDLSSVHPDFRELVESGLVDRPAGEKPGRSSVYQGIRQWNTLAQGPRSGGNRISALSRILELLGIAGDLEDVGEGVDRRGRNQFVGMDLRNVALSGEALLPDFGSRMSPGGARLRVQLMWGRPSPLELTEWSRSDASDDRTVLVLYFGLLTAKQRLELLELARTRGGPVISVVDTAVLAYLAVLAAPDWATTVRLTAPFTVSHPFQAEQMIPEEMFYGRREALEAVRAPSGAHFVYGGRQLGKSVLLKEAERLLRKDSSGTTVIMRDIRSVSQASEVWRILGTALEEEGIRQRGTLNPATRESVCAAVREWSRRNPDRRLMLFLDEADSFLTIDADEHGFENMVAFRELMNATDNRFKVVFAGLHNTSRFRSLPNQPFANLGEPVSIGPLASPDAFDLLVRPLRTLGLHLPDELAVSIIALANNAPALVQYFGQELLRRLRSAPRTELPYTITAEDVDAVQTGQNMVTAFRNRFDWTLNLDHRYKVIAYVVALHTINDRETVLSEKFLLQECQVWWPDEFEECPWDEFTSLVEECVDLGVLTRQEREHDVDGYRLRTPHILTLLGGSQRVEQELLQAQETYDKPGVFDAASYRRPREGRSVLSPLTAGQVSLLSRSDRRVRLVVGSQGTLVDQVPAALHQVKDEWGATVWEVGGNRQPIQGAFSRFTESGRHLVLVHLPQTAKSALRELAEADSLLQESPSPASVIALARPELAEVISGAMDHPFPDLDHPVLERCEVVELRRFGTSGLRQWRLLDHFSGLIDEAVQTRLLQVTGGWPALVNRVIEEVAEKGRNPEQVLDELERWLTAPGNAAEFVRTTGVLQSPVLERTWQLISAYETPERTDQLAQLIDMGAEEDPGLKARLGASPTTRFGLVEVLRALGALVPELQPAQDGRRHVHLHPEPVLTRAFRLSREGGDR
ncbi:hypothetical protein [Nocardiopsis changdeensis]|uniref:hypothetical protein n=1 Tax=Nocardiopsis changdeensis TaxID=2831969 RepID=UPI003F44F802